MDMKIVGVFVALLLLASAGVCGDDSGLTDYTIIDAVIPVPLSGVRPNPVRGRDIVFDIQRGNCLACHRVSNEPEEQSQGNLGPSLAGVGQRLSAAQLRLRLVDSTIINPSSIMPAYYRVANLNRVAAAYRGRPVLNALEIEDVIAYLQTLDFP